MAPDQERIAAILVGILVFALRAFEVNLRSGVILTPRYDRAGGLFMVSPSIPIEH